MVAVRTPDVCLCVSVSFLHFLLRWNQHWIGHMLDLILMPGVNVLLNITRWKISPPPVTTLPHLFCVHCCWKKKVCSEESHCFSSVPTKKPRQLYQTQRNQTELTWQQTWTKKDAKCSPVTQTLVFLVQTSSCNFILESLWIPGTSILRYSIYRLNYESKLYQYVKILYVQLNCSCYLVHWVVYALLFAG